MEVKGKSKKKVVTKKTNSKSKIAKNKPVIIPHIADKKETKNPKEEWVTIRAIVGSIVFTPKERAQLKKDGIDLMLVLKNTQEKIYK